jgi:Xaa-Pro aminopeptidase
VSEELSNIPEPDVSEENPISEHWVWVGPHRPACPRTLFEHMTSHWGPAPLDNTPHPAIAFTAHRRVALANQFPDAAIVVPTGNLKVRANDTDYRFRPGTDFYYLTACFDPDTVLVITSKDGVPHSTLYVAERRNHLTHEFFTNARYGELWVGPRRGVEESAEYLGITTAPLEQLAADLASVAALRTLVVRGFDHGVDELVPQHADDHALVEALGDMRLVKDDFEVAQLQLAIDYTVKGFADVVRALPVAVEHGERVIEGVFNLRARVEGNDVGYDTIAASGAHATILHWTTNDGVVRNGDLLLLDAGVECHNLYTADVTRTMPINGKFTDAQRKLYELVLRAQQAAIEVIAPGVPFIKPHETAMQIIAEGLCEWGILKEAPEIALRRDKQLHRRYTLHGTSHMLGLDVHDCANARDDSAYGDLQAGFVLTVEPGLYFQANDLTVPEEYRGIGIRIEDDILVTETGYRNLSAALPREVDEIEAWMANIQKEGKPAIL